MSVHDDQQILTLAAEYCESSRPFIIIRTSIVVARFINTCFDVGANHFIPTNRTETPFEFPDTRYWGNFRLYANSAMVQTRSQAKTTTTTATTAAAKTKTTKLQPKKRTVAQPSTAPATENDFKAPVTKETSTIKPSKAIAAKKRLEKDDMRMRKVVSAVAIDSEPLKSSLQEAPRRGRKKAGDSKIKEKIAAEVESEVQQPVEAKTDGNDGGDPNALHKIVNDSCAGPSKAVKKAEDMNLKCRTATSTAKQQQAEERNYLDTTPSAVAAASTKGRSRRAVKSQCSTNIGAGHVEKRRNARITNKNASKTERSGKSQGKQTEAHDQLLKDKRIQLLGKPHRQKQVAPEKGSAKGASVASKRQKVTATTLDDTKSATKHASEPVKTSSRKAISAASIVPTTSYIERKEHRDMHQPTPPLLHAASPKNRSKPNVDQSPLKKPPRSPVKMLMAITPAKRSNDEIEEDEHDGDDEENSIRNPAEREWQAIRNIKLNSIKRSPAKMRTMQETSTECSFLETREKNVGKDIFGEDGDVTETETEEEEDKKKEKSVTKSTLFIPSEDAGTLVTSTENAATLLDAPTSNPAPTPLTFKPSSLRFLPSLTPMFAAHDKSKAVAAHNSNNRFSEKKHQSGKLKERDHYASSLATAPQAYKSSKPLITPSKLVDVAASLFRTPFSASTRPLTPFRSAPYVTNAVNFAPAGAHAKDNILDATSASAGKSKDSEVSAPISVPNSLFKSVMRVPQSSNGLTTGSSMASLLSANEPKIDNISPDFALPSPQSPTRVGLSADTFALSTPSLRTPSRLSTEMRNEQTAKATRADTATYMPFSKSHVAAPMTEPAVPRPILKSALKMPASSKLSTSVAVNKVKKLTFLDQKEKVIVSEEEEETVTKNAFDNHGGKLVSGGIKMSPAWRDASPTKTVTFESPNPLLETSTPTKARRQPMAATAEEACEYMEKMGTAEESSAQGGSENGTRESLAGSISGQILSGAIFFLDVNSADGADAADIFIPLLTEMGATCVPRWQNSLDGITHVLFKDGQKKTLEKVAASGGKIKCVNIGWPLEYVMRPAQRALISS